MIPFRSTPVLAPILAAAAFAMVAFGAGPARAQEKVVFATNWKAQAAHGGFYSPTARTRAWGWTSRSARAGRR